MRVRLTAVWLSCVVIAFPADLSACTCAFGPAFLAASAREDLVIRARVVRYVAHGMDVEVLETFKGAPGGATVRIWGDTGILCRPYVTQFPIGTEWIFAVGNGTEPQERGFVISVCGEYAVRVEKDVVTGFLTEIPKGNAARETMGLDELRKRLEVLAK